jgi:hypothetical protein
MLDGQSLIAAAGREGLAVTPRTLRRLRTQGLLPHPVRTGQRGLTPVWTYPSGTEAQLVTLLRWRQKTKSPDVLQVVLWLEGFAVCGEEVRAALTRRLRLLLEGIEQELRTHARRCGLDPDTEAGRREALQSMASVLAGKRGPAAIPRHGRMTAADRVRGLTLLLTTFGFGEPGVGEEDAQTVERVLGIAPNGRRTRIGGQGPWLTGPAEALFGATEVASFPRLLDVAEDATDAELAAVRPLAAALFLKLPFFLRLIDVATSKNNALGMAGLSKVSKDPEFGVFVVPTLVSMLRAGWEENLRTMTQALEGTEGLQAIIPQALEMDSKTWTTNLAALPAAQREQARRIIDAAVDGTLEFMPPARPGE